MLREQIEHMETERERAQPGDQIESLKVQVERQSADHGHALAVLSDERESVADLPKRGLWARLMGLGS